MKKKILYEISDAASSEFLRLFPEGNIKYDYIKIIYYSEQSSATNLGDVND